MLNEQRKLRIYVTALTCSRKHLRKWLKPRLRRRQVGTHLKMIHARTNHLILNNEVLYMRSSVDCGRHVRWNPRRRTIWQTKFARSSPKTVTRNLIHPSNQGHPREGRPQRVWVVRRAARPGPWRDHRDERAHPSLPRRPQFHLVTTMRWTTWG